MSSAVDFWANCNKSRVPQYRLVTWQGELGSLHFADITGAPIQFLYTCTICRHVMGPLTLSANCRLLILLTVLQTQTTDVYSSSLFGKIISFPLAKIKVKKKCLLLYPCHIKSCTNCPPKIIITKFHDI